MWDLTTLRKLNSKPGNLSETGQIELCRILEECGMTNLDVAKLQPKNGMALCRKFIRDIRNLEKHHARKNSTARKR